jgi:hypothetical protein
MSDESKRRTIFAGRVVEATPVGYTPAVEPWTELLLADGSVFRAKLVIQDVLRLDDIYEPDGTPVYQVRWAVVSYSVPTEAMRKLPA